MTEEPKRPPPPADEPGVEGGDRDVSTDVQPPASGVPPEPDDESAAFEERPREGQRGREDLN